MDYRLLNAIRDFQVASQECDLYSGSVDGKWGKGSVVVATAIFTDYNQRVNGGRHPIIPFPVPATWDDGQEAIKLIQRNLKLLNLYSGDIDGIWGEGSNAGLLKVFNSYRAYNKIRGYDLAYSTKVPAEFLAKVKSWVGRKGYWARAASDLMACMKFESAGTFSPTIQNQGGAQFFGLIQFGKDAATDLGLTLDQIKAMSQLEQLDLVFKYFEMWEKRGKVYRRMEDFYLTIFYPAAVGKGPNEVIFRRDSTDRMNAKGYIQNKGFDAANTGVITVGQICERMYSEYYEGMRLTNRVRVNTLY